MKITKIRILNYLGIATFVAEAPGKLNIIKGKNGSGKSSVVKAITELFKSSGVDPHIIKNGAESAEILIELDGRIAVERTITHDKNQVKVVTDGAKIAAPQTFLKSLFGEYQFNPVEFFLSDMKRRRDILLSAIPLRIDQDRLRQALGDLDIPVDLSTYNYDRHGLEVLDAIKKDIYNRRHEQGIVVSRLEKAIEQDKRDLPEGIDAGQYDGFDFDSTLAALQEANRVISEHDKKLAARDNLRSQAEATIRDIEETERRLASLREQLDDIRVRGNKLTTEIDGFKAPDVASLQAEISGYQAAQKHIHKVEDIRSKERSLLEQSGLHAALDALYKAMAGDVPKQLLAEADMPIDGLELTDDAILVNGVQIDKLSTSEQIQLANRVAKATAGELNVICIDRWESLDKAAQSIFAAEAEKDDFEYFVTEVNTDCDECNGDGCSACAGTGKDERLRMQSFGSVESAEAGR